MGITHFIRNAKVGTRFTHEGAAYEVADSPNCSPNLIILPCFVLRRGEYAERKDLTLRFGRDRVEVYGW